MGIRFQWGGSLDPCIWCWDATLDHLGWSIVVTKPVCALLCRRFLGVCYVNAWVAHCVGSVAITGTLPLPPAQTHGP